MTLKEILKHIQSLQVELKDRVKESEGYGNTFDNGCDKGWLEALVYIETRLKGIQEE